MHDAAARDAERHVPLDAPRPGKMPASASAAAWRSFPSICDACLGATDGRIERAADDVYLVRDCAAHGTRFFLVSRNGAAFERYDRFRDAALRGGPAGTTPRAFFFLTPACNLGCGYCLNEANRYAYFDAFDVERFEAELATTPGEHVSVVGGEPFAHPQFFDFVAAARRHRKTVLVFTNGLALADECLAERFVTTTEGRCQIYMTFEGFTPGEYAHLPVLRVRERKLAALAHLERYGVPLVLHRTLVSEPRDDERAGMRALVDYALAHEHVRAVAFQPVVAVGGARHFAATDVCSVDRAMDRVLEALPVRVARTEVYAIQKALALVGGVLGAARCPHMQVAALVRRGGVWEGVDAYVDCERLDRCFDAGMQRGAPTRARMARILAQSGVGAFRWRRLPALARLVFDMLPAVRRGFDVGALPRRVLPVVVSTVCDRFNYDETLASHCDKRVHSQVRGGVIVESASEMSLRQARERAAHERAEIERRPNGEGDAQLSFDL